MFTWIYLAFQTGYLTKRELNIWNLRNILGSQAKIARKLDVSRQAIHKSLLIIDKKVEQALNEAALTNNLDVRKLDVVHGVMYAYSPAYKIPVIISLSKVNGLKVWYLYEGNCRTCNRNEECLELLESEANERGIKIDANNMSPSNIAKNMFLGYFKEDSDE